MHSKDKLAEALRDAGLPGLADLAAQGHYHDFLSPLATPAMQLAHDLEVAIRGGNAKAGKLLERHMNGEFDATDAEADEWAVSQDGVATFRSLLRSHLEKPVPMPSGNDDSNGDGGGDGS